MTTESRVEDERALVEGLLANDAAAVTEFLRRTHHPVYCMACRVASDVTLRRDWSHDVLLGILEDLELGRFVYRGPGSFWAWFKKRAYFRLLDHARRVRTTREREAPVGGTDDLPESILPEGEDPAAELERIETRAAVETCMSRLENRDHRRVLALLLFEGMPYEAIADELGTPLNTVRAWIRRGRIQLRRCLVKSLGLVNIAGDP